MSAPHRLVLCSLAIAGALSAACGSPGAGDGAAKSPGGAPTTASIPAAQELDAELADLDAGLEELDQIDDTTDWTAP